MNGQMYISHIFATALREIRFIAAPAGAGNLSRLVGIEMDDLRGNVVVGATRWVAQQQGDATHRPYIWHPDKSISLGIYLVKVRMENGQQIMKRIVYLR